MAFPSNLTNAVDGVTDVVADHLNNLEAKVGIDCSLVTTSLDYLLKNTASVDPGHVHTVLSGGVTLAKMANLAANSIIGNNTGSPATPLALSTAQVKTLLAISQADVAGLSTASSPNFAALTAASLTSTEALAINAGGSNQNITLTPSGSGFTIIHGYIGAGGITSPVAYLEIVGNTGISSAKFGTFEIQSYAINNGWLTDNLYYNGGSFKYRSNGYGCISYFTGGGYRITTAASGIAGDAATIYHRLIINNDGSFGIGGSISGTGGSLSGSTLMGNTSGNVGIGTATPNAAALLHLVSTTKGFLPPVMTMAQKAAVNSPPAGLMVYDATLNKLCVYTGAAWQTITSA